MNGFLDDLMEQSYLPSVWTMQPTLGHSELEEGKKKSVFRLNPLYI